jgi:N-glycosylase/DNA lyase
MMTKDLQQRLASVLPYEFGMASDQMNRHLIFTRVLGFELEMPGSEYWHAFKHHAKECWICERRVLTVVLWSPEFGEFETKQI